MYTHISLGTDLVVDLGLELDSGLDDINRSQGTVGDGTTKSTSKSEPWMSAMSHFPVRPRSCRENTKRFKGTHLA